MAVNNQVAGQQCKHPLRKAHRLQDQLQKDYEPYLQHLLSEDGKRDAPIELVSFPRLSRASSGHFSNLSSPTFLNISMIVCSLGSVPHFLDVNAPFPTVLIEFVAAMTLLFLCTFGLLVGSLRNPTKSVYLWSFSQLNVFQEASIALSHLIVF